MNYFVFVVCGAREHIETLNFSLKFILHFSKYPVLVVTDNKRNEIPVEHDQILDIVTPDEYDHHQASIYLKTGLHKFLNMKDDSLYCYLDSDIVAINAEINTIFDYFRPPIIFAKDHCPFNEFSPHAMQCACLADTLRKNKEYAVVDEFFQQNIFFKIQENNTDKIKLDLQFELLKEKSIKHVFPAMIYFIKRHLLPIKQIKLGEYHFNKTDGFWYNASNEIIHFDWSHAVKLLEKTGVHYNKRNKTWRNCRGEDIMPQVPHCMHLGEYIAEKYKIMIPSDWRHWNGGVFLFNADGIEFMNYWHEITLKEFENPATKTRDQGTLAVTAWVFNLQETITLPEKFNFITEYDNPDIVYTAEKGFTKDGYKSTFTPCFLHIYHQWGRTGWSIWDYVSALEKTIIKSKN